MNNNIAVQKVFIEMMLNNEKVEAVANSPLAPFTLEDEGNCHQVDIAAEEFINNFYKELNRQNRTIAS